MRRLLIVALFSFISLIAESQKLKVEGTAPDLYITHIVAPKENFYSVSRFYNQPPKAIAAFNKIEMEKGLTIGQHVKIPLTAQNLDGSGSSSANGRKIALTHIVAKSETLFRISNNLQVTPEAIKKLNNLSSDNIAAGTSIIVGYLKTTNSQASASAAKSNTTATISNSEPAKKGMNEADTKQNTSEASSAAAGGTPAKQKTKNVTETEKHDENMQSVKEPEKNISDQNTAAAEKDTALAVIPESTTVAPATEESAKQPETSSTKTNEGKKTNEPTVTGTFEEMYASRAANKSENTKSGEAATFKSTSGWQDKKYYVLVNDIDPGTIVKISSSDNKSIYAKVLGSMPEMKENNGLLLRISNAAASSLGIIDPKFHVQVSYY